MNFDELIDRHRGVPGEVETHEVGRVTGAWSTDDLERAMADRESDALKAAAGLLHDVAQWVRGHAPSAKIRVSHQICDAVGRFMGLRLAIDSDVAEIHVPGYFSDVRRTGPVTLVDVYVDARRATQTRGLTADEWLTVVVDSRAGLTGLKP